MVLRVRTVYLSVLSVRPKPSPFSRDSDSGHRVGLTWRGSASLPSGTGDRTPRRTRSGIPRLTIRCLHKLGSWVQKINNYLGKMSPNLGDVWNSRPGLLSKTAGSRLLRTKRKA